MEFGYSKAVAKDREVEMLEREAEERTAPPAVLPRVARAKRAQRKQQGVPAAAPEPAAPAEVATTPAVAEQDLRHGTTWGYARGCKDSATCPRSVDGRSCTEAQNQYQREYRARKKAELQEQRDAVASPDPVGDEPHEEMATEVAEEPKPRGKRVLDDALRTITEAAELQQALAVITERALRAARIEINHMRREAAALENQEK
jgi:hypothetical protein